jgi:hypothetical protein
MAKFCSNCGSTLNEGARFCHACGSAIGSPIVATGKRPTGLFWAPIVASVIAVVALVLVQFGSLGLASDGEVQPIDAGRAPDISSMSPEERADRLFDRVMRMAGEGKKDSAAFFAPMALGAIEALGPADTHRRYDMGLVGLVSGDLTMAAAQADTILDARPTHLLGLALAAKVADARGDASAASAFRRRLIASEAAERAAGLPEYAAHAQDLDDAIALARGR